LLGLWPICKAQYGRIHFTEALTLIPAGEMSMRAFCLRNKLAAILMAFFMMLFGFYGCSGSGTDNPAATGQVSDTGEVAVSLTDAPGDFATYTVDVLSLTLTKANGTEVSTMPLETRLDFTQYTDMTEFLTSATVPSGVYVAATLTLDYSDADIWVEDETEGTVQVAPENIVDENGDPITTLELTVQLEGRNRLPIAPGIPAHLLLDFDLNATHLVNLDDPQSPVMTVEPLLVAQVNRTPLKIHRVRGALNEVNVDQSGFSLFLRPFYCPLSGSHRHFGTRTVTTTSETVFEIDGVQYVGEAGLDAMAALDPLTAVVAMGDLKFGPLRFEARQVYTGSSVPGGTKDVVRGNVISRLGDVLTVKGATLIRGESSMVFNNEVTVNIGEETVVTRQLSADPIGTYGKDDISVGQRVVIFGTLVQDGQDLVLDADTSDSHVRMVLTTVRGTALSRDDAAESLVLGLETIDRRAVELFDFAGTNTDPENYQIYTGQLDLSQVEINAPMKVRGFVESFGAAPPDFNAQSVVFAADLRAILNVHWNPATNAAFESVSTDELVLNLEGATHSHHVFRGWERTDLSEMETPISLVPEDDGRGAFVIRNGDGSSQLFTDFEGFAQALSDDPGGDLKVKKLHASGDFDNTGAVLTADFIDVHFAAEGQNGN
jgi:hypothetical protein